MRENNVAEFMALAVNASDEKLLELSAAIDEIVEADAANQSSVCNPSLTARSADDTR